jgi:hypothetical protein
MSSEAIAWDPAAKRFVVHLALDPAGDPPLEPEEVAALERIGSSTAALGALLEEVPPVYGGVLHNLLLSQASYSQFAGVDAVRRDLESHHRIKGEERGHPEPPHLNRVRNGPESRKQQQEVAQAQLPVTNCRGRSCACRRPGGKQLSVWRLRESGSGTDGSSREKTNSGNK